MSIDWLAIGYDRREVTMRPGEVADAPRPYSGWPKPLFIDWPHVCGTDEEFRDGAKYDAGRVVEYDEQGFPLCCGQPAVMRLAMVIGFEIEVPEVPTIGTGVDCAHSVVFAVPAAPASLEGWLEAYGIIGSGVSLGFAHTLAVEALLVEFLEETSPGSVLQWNNGTCSSTISFGSITVGGSVVVPVVGGVGFHYLVPLTFDESGGLFRVRITKV